MQGSELTQRYRATYLNDHLAAATAGVQLTERATRHPGVGDPAQMAQLRKEIREDLASLRDFMAVLGISERPYKRLLALAAERVSRLKLNGKIVRTSELTPLVELEGLTIAITGKRAGWLSLRTIAETDTRLDRQRLDGLVDRAGKQLDMVEPARRQAAQLALQNRGSGA